MNKVPSFIYGTAWKESKTKTLVLLALRHGFCAIDTANQRKHYDENAVGEGINEYLNQENSSRDELFIQTKFTHIGGQDHRLPYKPGAPITEQVEQSFVSSLNHLRTKFIDSYILHGPSLRLGLSDEDWMAWHAMESIFNSGKIKFLGISNITLEQLKILYEGAKIPPKFVQNRCYGSQNWDLEIRNFCKAKDIVYQGFSLLTANHNIVQSTSIKEIAQRYERTPSQIIFRFAYDLGIIPLTGTTNPAHMAQDLDVFNFHLEKSDIKVLENFRVLI